MKNILIKSPFLFAIFFLFSCQFQFQDDNFNQIEIINPEFQLKVSNYVNGEIIRDNKNIRFTFSSRTNNQIFSIIYYLDNRQVISTRELITDIPINLSDLEDGEHTIKIEVILKSESGSLNDVYHLESFQFTESLIFFVNKSIDLLEIKNVEHKDGSIYVSWDSPSNIERYKEINLIKNESYRTTKIPLLGSDSLVNKNVFRDSLALSFNIKYQIEVVSNHVSRKSTINNFYVEDSLVSIEHEFLDKNSYKIKWNRHPLYNNFDNYKLTYNNKEEIIDNKGGEKIINSSFTFGHSQYYNISLDRQSYIPDNKPFYSSITYGAEYENNNYHNLIFDNNLNCYFASSISEHAPYNIEIFKLKASDLSVLHKIEFANKYYRDTPDILIDTNQNLILDLRGKSFVLSTENLTVKEEYDINDFDPDIFEFISKTRYRNGLLILDNDYTFRNIYVFNAATKQLITILKKQYSTVFTKVSNYFIVERDVYKIENKNISLIYSVDPSLPRLYDIDFVPSINSLALLIGGASGNGFECVFLNLNNNITSKIIGTEQTSYFNHDPTTNNILFINKQSNGTTKANLYNVNNGIMSTITVAGHGINYLFLNNYLLLSYYNYYLENPF